MNDRDVKKYPYLQKSVDTTDWKLETSFHGTRRRFTFVSFFGGHGTLGPFAGESLARKAFSSFARHVLRLWHSRRQQVLSSKR